MPVRLLTGLQHNGVRYPKGAVVDLDALGLDQKSFVAQGQAEAVEPGDDQPEKLAEPTDTEGTKVGGKTGDAAAQTMERKARGRG